MKRKSKDEILMKIIVHAVLLTFVILTIFPMVFTVIISLTDQKSLANIGYSLIPESWSWDAYKYLFQAPAQLLNGYKNSIIITVGGTIGNVLLTLLMAYPLSRPDFAYKKFFNVLVFIPMLFSGGMVANYLLIVKYLGWKNNYLSVMVPAMCGSFNVFMLRVLLQDVPMSLQESAKIDGASDFRTLLTIVMPLSKPALATLALRSILAYWNNTTSPQLYLIKPDKHPITMILQNIVDVVTEMKQALLDPSTSGGLMIDPNDIPSDTIIYALMVVATVPLLLVFTRLQKYFSKGMVSGGVKG
ncbi:MAG: carbohydrate ABC transporter permease [Lachnospiraceae bacterium]|nr:carbohydrate ABC transporter permease [Lachnospiraceae bacterium]